MFSKLADKISSSPTECAVAFRRQKNIAHRSVVPYPDEIKVLSDTYALPALIPYYCATTCAFGPQLPPFDFEHISEIVENLDSRLGNSHDGESSLLQKLCTVLQDSTVSLDECCIWLDILKDLKCISSYIHGLNIWAINHGYISVCTGNPAPLSEIYCDTRTTRGLTQSDAGSLIGVSRVTISKIEQQLYSHTAPNRDLFENIKKLSLAYHEPALRNYFCTHSCPLLNNSPPLKYKPEELGSIATGLISALYLWSDKIDDLRQMAQDNQITEEELDNFISSLDSLNQMIYAVDSMLLWTRTILFHYLDRLLKGGLQETELSAWNDTKRKLIHLGENKVDLEAMLPK